MKNTAQGTENMKKNTKNPASKALIDNAINIVALSYSRGEISLGEMESIIRTIKTVPQVS